METLQTDDDALERVVIELSAAFNARDTAAIASLYVDEAVLMPPNEQMVKGAVAGRQTWFQ